MAKIRYSGVVSGMSGKLGEEVHYHSRSGEVVRKKSKSKYKKTKPRIKVNATFGKSSRSWSDLTEKQMERWDNIAKVIKIKSIGTRNVIKTGYLLYNYSTLNLQEIGEPAIKGVIVPEYPQIADVAFEYISKKGKKDKRDIIIKLKKAIQADTKIIISATKGLGKGVRYVDKSWYKKIGYIDSSFKSGDSILAQYLRIFKEVDEEKYKIHFKIREVNKNSGISNFERSHKMVLFPDESKRGI